MKEFDIMMRKIAMTPGFDEESYDYLNAGEGTQDEYPAKRPVEEDPFDNLVSDASENTEQEKMAAYSVYMNKIGRIGYVIPSLIGMGALTLGMKALGNNRNALQEVSKNLQNRTERDLEEQGIKMP